jgi:hypothetical protein
MAITSFISFHEKFHQFGSYVIVIISVKFDLIMANIEKLSASTTITHSSLSSSFITTSSTTTSFISSIFSHSSSLSLR